LSATADRTNMDAAVRRITASASSDDGYRAQLVNLADSNGGIYRTALDALYAQERDSLGAEEARLRRARDEQLLADTRERERRRKALAEFEHAVTLAEAGEQAERAARAVIEYQRAKLVRLAGSDSDLRQRLLGLANKREGVYAEALEGWRPEYTPTGGVRDDPVVLRFTVMDDDTIDVTFTVGEWMPTLELADILDRERAEAESSEPSEED
jgi:hypothetical protein